MKLKLAMTNTVKASTMAVGDIGRITNDEIAPEIVIRVYDGVVSLTNPRNVWSGTNIPSFDVQLLPKGTQVILEQE